MTCVRHLERIWQTRNWERFLRHLLAGRPEECPRLRVDLNSMVAAAALGMIRLDELQQSHSPLFGRLLRTVLASQDADGGWRDPLTTALCIRALLIDRGAGLAIERGLAYLATMQKPQGIWPREPLRRFPADPFISACILFELGHRAAFRSAVRCEDALCWFEHHDDELDADTRRIWSLAAIQCRFVSTPTEPQESSSESSPALLWC